MAERYGLLVIIVLGEGILGSTNTIATAVAEHSLSLPVILSLGLGSFAVIFLLWWVYFNLPEERLHSMDAAIRQVFPTAYGHYVIFAALTVVGTGLELLADSLINAHQAHTGHSVSALSAISILSLAVFFSLSGILFISHLIDPVHRRLNKRCFLALLLCALPVVAVSIGLSLNLAVWLSTLAPLMMLCAQRKRHYKSTE